jgi:MFS family permease
MKDFLRKYSKLLSILLGAIYGALIGTVLALVTGGNVFAWALAWALALAGAGALALALATAWALALAVAWALALALTGAGAGAVAVALALALAVALALAWAWAWAGALAGATIDYLAKRNKTTREELIENHTIWVFSLLIAIFDWFFRGLASSKHSKTKQSKTKQRAWDVNLVVTFTQEVAEVFPEEWEEWQHWISDMMDLRKRMQAKGINHHLVSLITFYRLVRFALHIGIDKIFILATRRATR